MISYRKMNRREALRYSGGVAALAGVTGAKASLRGGAITDVGNLRVGHYTDQRRPTGCTVILFEPGAVAGVDVRGSAPGTRETDLLQPLNTVQRVNAIVLSGGSAFGLDSASGVMRYLEERKQGYRVGNVVVPIVPAAILFDLNVGDSNVRPDASSGYAACQNAREDSVEEGNVGAGAGATIGKFFGHGSAMKSGLGTASIRIGDSGLIVGAIVAVNAAGDVIDRRKGHVLAGALTPDGAQFRNTMAHIAGGNLLAGAHSGHGENTTIGVIATNAALTKTEITKVAQMAHDGMARSINPIHTAADGDAIFAAATCTSRVKADTITIGAIAAEAMSDAIEQAVLMAKSIPGYLARCDLRK